MLNISIPVHGVAESVMKPSVISVVDDIKKMLHIGKDVWVQYSNDKGIGSDTLAQRDGKFNNYKEWVSIDYEEQPFPDMALVTTPVNPDYKPICRDDEIGLLIQPIYQYKKLNITFKYHVMSKSRAIAMMSTLNSMTANDAHTRYHELEYFYNIGNFTTSLLNEIVLLKNKRLKQDEQLTLEDYIRSTFDDRVNLTYTEDARLEKAEVVIREAQLQVVGYIEDSTYDMKLEFDQDIEQWYIEIPYTISYEKITNLKLRYPILVYNNLIHKQYRVFEPYYKNRPLAKRTERFHGIHEITKEPPLYTLEPLVNNDYLTIPKDDNIVLPQTDRIYTRLFSVLCILDPKDMTFLFNIKDTPGIRFNNTILDLLLTSEYKYIGKFLNSIIYMELFENRNRCYNIELTMDNEGNIRSNKPLDIKKTYRVVFSIINNLSLLESKSSYRLSKFLRYQLDRIELEGNDIEPINILYYNIFNVVTPFKSKTELLKYAKEDMKYGLIKPRYDAMRTVAVNTVIIADKVFDIVDNTELENKEIKLPEHEVKTTPDYQELIKQKQQLLEEERNKEKNKEKLNNNVPLIEDKNKNKEEIDPLTTIDPDDLELSDIYQDEILELINKIRIKEGLLPLSIDPDSRDEALLEIIENDIDSNGIDNSEDMFNIWKNIYNFLDPNMYKIGTAYLYRNYQHYWSIKILTKIPDYGIDNKDI